jgi:hypothetical protein
MPSVTPLGCQFDDDGDLFTSALHGQKDAGSRSLQVVETAKYTGSKCNTQLQLRIRYVS